MGIAIFTFEGLMAPLHGLVRWWMGLPSAAVQPCPTQAPPRQARAATPRAARPLRVLRVVDPAQGRAGSGRLVISGRLADVCAELDRLAALEAAPVQAALWAPSR